MAAHLAGRGGYLSLRWGRIRPSSRSGVVVVFSAVFLPALEERRLARGAGVGRRWGGFRLRLRLRIGLCRLASVGSALVSSLSLAAWRFGLFWPCFGFCRFLGCDVCVRCGSGEGIWPKNSRLRGLVSGRWRTPVRGSGVASPLAGALGGRVGILWGGFPFRRCGFQRGLLGRGGFPPGLAPEVRVLWGCRLGFLRGLFGRGGFPPGRISAPEVWGPLLGLLGSSAYDTHSIPR